MYDKIDSFATNFQMTLLENENQIKQLSEIASFSDRCIRVNPGFKEVFEAATTETRDELVRILCHTEDLGKDEKKSLICTSNLKSEKAVKYALLILDLADNQAFKGTKIDMAKFDPEKYTDFPKNMAKAIKSINDLALKGSTRIDACKTLKTQYQQIIEKYPEIKTSPNFLKYCLSYFGRIMRFSLNDSEMGTPGKPLYIQQNREFITDLIQNIAAQIDRCSYQEISSIFTALADIEVITEDPLVQKILTQGFERTCKLTETENTLEDRIYLISAMGKLGFLRSDNNVTRFVNRTLQQISEYNFDEKELNVLCAICIVLRKMQFPFKKIDTLLIPTLQKCQPLIENAPFEQKASLLKSLAIMQFPLETVGELIGDNFFKKYASDVSARMDSMAIIEACQTLRYYKLPIPAFLKKELPKCRLPILEGNQSLLEKKIEDALKNVLFNTRAVISSQFPIAGYSTDLAISIPGGKNSSYQNLIIECDGPIHEKIKGELSLEDQFRQQVITNSGAMVIRINYQEVDASDNLEQLVMKKITDALRKLSPSENFSVTNGTPSAKTNDPLSITAKSWEAAKFEALNSELFANPVSLPESPASPPEHNPWEKIVALFDKKI